MDEMMEFPKTVDEFMEQYKVVDTDRVYSNGIEFVPIFRMKQWFEHTARPKGEWIDNETSYADGVQQTCTCSICGIRSARPLGDYCKWCGADMLWVE